MHSFTIVLVSTLSLGVHAASIGDSVSQLVTRQQHNRLFHNPDFTSANLPAAESFERAGKISRRFNINSGGSHLVGDLSEVFNIARPNTQANAQTFTVPSLSSSTLVDDLFSGMPATDSNTGSNTVNTPLNAQTVVNTQAATNAQAAQPQAAQAVANAQAAQAQAAQAAIIAQAQVQAAQAQAAQAQAAANPQAQVAQVQAAQAAIIAQAQAAANPQTQAAIVAQAAANPQAQAQAQAVNNAQAAIIAQAAIVAQAAANRQAQAQAAIVQDSAAFLSNVAEPLFAPNPLSQLVNNPGVPPDLGLSGNTVTANVVAQQDSQHAVKRQLAAPAAPAAGSPITLLTTAAQAANNTGLLAREDNTTNLFDDQVEDMDFSAHDSEADELEEGF